MAPILRSSSKKNITPRRPFSKVPKTIPIQKKVWAPLTLEYVAARIGESIEYYYFNGFNPNDVKYFEKECKLPREKQKNPIDCDYFISSKVLENFEKKKPPCTKIMMTSPDLEDVDNNKVIKNFLHDRKKYKLVPRKVYLLNCKYDFGNTNNWEDGTVQISDPYTKGPCKGIRCLSDNSANGDNWILL
jgi:hypothetical protein